MSSSPPTSYQSINVSVNGVVKNLIIPLNSLPAVTRVPTCPITVQPSQDVLISSQSSQTTVVSALPTPPQILALDPTMTGSKNGQSADSTVSGSGVHPKLTSILSAVRFQAGGRRTLLAIRPKSVTAAATGSAEAEKAATVVRTPTGRPAGELHPTVIRAVRPEMKITTVPVSGGGAETGASVSIIRPGQLIRSVPGIPSARVIRQPGSTTGNQRFQYVIQSGVRQVVPSAICRPKTIMVKALGVSDRNAKKMVMIRVPGGGSSETNAALGALQLKPGHAWVEVKDSRSNTVRYIQMQKKDPDKTMDAEPLPRATTPPPATEEVPSMADDGGTSEDIKVIEIVPDEDDDDDDDLVKPAGMPGKSEKEENQTDDKDIFKHPPPVLGPPVLLPNQDFDHSDGDSGSLRSGIFETLKNMSLEEATTAASALKIPGQGHDEQEDFTTTTDASLNIVLRGDDHMVIENPKYDDDDDDDDDDDENDDECTISAEEPSHDSDLTASEPHSLAASPRKPVQGKFPADLIIPGYPIKNPEPRKTERKRRNVARRTGGRPGVPQEGTARRSGGRPMTIKERYGVDVVECHVQLDQKAATNSSKPYKKWAEQQLGQILSRIKNRVIKKPEIAKIGMEGSRPLKRSETDGEMDQTSDLKGADDKKIAMKDCSHLSVTPVTPGRQRNVEKLKHVMSDSAIDFDGAEIDMGPIMVRKRTQRQKVKTDVNLEQTEDTGITNTKDDIEQNPEPGPARKRRAWSRKKLLPDSEFPQVSAGIQGEDEMVPTTGSNSNTDIGVRRRRTRKPRVELPDSSTQDGDPIDQQYPSKPQRKRRTVKRWSDPYDLGQGQSEFSTPLGGTGASNVGESGTKRRRRRRESNVESLPTSFVTVGTTLNDERSSVLDAASEVLRKQIIMKKSLLKPVTPVSTFPTATISPRLNITSSGSRLPSSPTSPLPIRIPPTNYQLVAGEPRSLTPTRPRPNLDQTKYYLVKTQKGSFLIPVPGTTPNQNPVSMAVSVPGPPPPPTAEVSRTLPKSPADDEATAASEDQSKSDPEDGGTYEPAVAGMRQEDRISLLKEKLRQQQALLAKMKKQ